MKVPMAMMAAVVLVAAAPTDGPRATLVRAAFATADKAQALAGVNSALTALDAILKRTPDDRNALLQQGIGLGYRGQLTRSIGDARRARGILEGLTKRNPNDPEAWVAYGGWHTSVIAYVGGFVGSSVLGANKRTGLDALSQAVRLGGNRAFFPAYAGLMRTRLDPEDAQALPLLERAGSAQAPAEVDRITQASARRVAALLKAGNRKEAQTLARQLLPFGRIA